MEKHIRASRNSKGLVSVPSLVILALTLGFTLLSADAFEGKIPVTAAYDANSSARQNKGLETGSHSQTSTPGTHVSRADRHVPVKRAEYCGIKVYDANDQFLGILLYMSYRYGSASEIFIPALHAATVIVEVVGTGTGHIINSVENVYFENSHCSGPAYLGTFATSPDIIYRLGNGDNLPRYFFGTAPVKKDFPISSKLDPYGNCSRWINSKSLHDILGYQAKEISEQEIPFTLPVALPLRYER